MATTMERFQKESIDYIINALLSSSKLIENCAICSYKDRTMIKKAIDYAVENKCDYLVTPEGALSGYDHGDLARRGFDPFENMFTDTKVIIFQILFWIIV